MDNRYMLNICGVSIGVISNMSEEYIKNLAKKAESLIMDIRNSSEFANLEMSAIVATISAFEDLDEMKKSVISNRDMQKNNFEEIDEYKNKYEQSKLEIEKLRRELDVLRSPRS